MTASLPETVHASSQVRKSRRPQAERSAETRAKLIEAAIQCLHKNGYTATTLASVADAAGVSRGAITHHFASKADLAIAVVTAVNDETMAFYEAHRERLDAATYLRRLPELLWEVESRPAGIATMEVFLAARADDKLATRLAELQRGTEIRATASLEPLLAAVGIPRENDEMPVRKLFVAAVRGLAIDRLVTRDGHQVQESIKVLTKLLQLLYPTLAE